MKAELENGTIVDLEKECGCITHEGPHWIHMDKMDRERNKKLLMIGGDLATRGFLIEDLERVKQKRRNMELRKIRRLIE